MPRLTCHTAELILTFVGLLCLISQFSDASKHVVYTRQRTRRQTLSSRVFVVPQRLTGDLFNVSSWPPNPQDFYSFGDPAPENLMMSPAGMVSLMQGKTLNISNITFSVTVNNTDALPRTVRVAMYVVKRGAYNPVFINSPSPMWATCPVWIRPETTIYQVQAIDSLQYGAIVQYRLESGGEGEFDVDPVSGDVFIVGRHMFEVGKIYELAISAQIKGMVPSGSTPSQVLQVYVGAKNPQFSVPVYNISFYESESGVIYKVQAKSFQNLTLTYSFDTNDDPSRSTFGLDSATGDITLLTRLSYRLSPHQYNFNVTVKEAYSNYVTTTTLTINLLSNNHPPVFLVSYYVKNDFSEDVPVDTLVLEVMAYDYDPGAFGQLTFSTTDDHFKVKKTSDSVAMIQVAKKLDYDRIEGHRYEFSVVATDGGNLNDTATVQVWMKNLNDEAPVFEPENQIVILKEGAKAGLRLWYIQAYDPDGDNITFDLSNPDPDIAAMFGLDSTTGLLTLKRDIPTGGSNPVLFYNMTVTITDDGSCCQRQSPGQSPRRSTGSVGVRINRVNTQPVFTECRNYQPEVAELAPVGTLVQKMVAIDADNGPSNVLTFSTFKDGTQQEYFNVRPDANNPMIAELFTTVVFNRERAASTLGALKFNDTWKVPVTVIVQDNGSPSLSTNCIMLVTIKDVNDNPPVFDYASTLDSDTAYQTNVVSDLPTGSRVVRVFAMDVDFGDNAKISYSFGQNSDVACTSNFSIDANSGWITKLSSNTPLGKITCYVIAKDSGTPPLNSSALVPITVLARGDPSILPVWQNYPGTDRSIDDFKGLYVNETDSNLALVNLNARPFTGTVTVNYFLHNDPQLPISDRPFSSNTVGNNMMSIVMNKPVDASQKWIHYLRCRAFYEPSPNSMASVARLQVNIKDVNDKVPFFLGMDVNGVYPASVSTYTSPGDSVVNVTAIDLDREWPNNLITYSFNFADGCSDTPNCTATIYDKFTIDSVTGEIKANSRTFDPNQVPTYTLGVIAEDGLPGMTRNRGYSRVYVLVIGTSKTSPKFNRNFTGNVPEGSVYDTTVVYANVSVNTSFDVGPQYGIMSGDEGHRFAVNFSSGRVYVVGDLNTLQRPTYTLGYRVFDGAVIDTTFIFLTVTRSATFKPPVFEQVLYVSNGAYVEKDSDALNKVVGVVKATSRDGSDVTYSLVPQTENFNVNPQTGSVTLAKSLSRDAPVGYDTWQFNVKATDSSNSEGYAVVSLILKDINDHTPVFETCCLLGIAPEIPPQAGSPTGVLQLQAWDPDNGPNGTVTYSFPPGQASPFSITRDGLITVASRLNYTAQNNYTLTVQATDGGNLKASQQIVILVEDANDNFPIFAPPKRYNVTIPENMDIGSSVLVLEATDADVGIKNTQLTYTINTGADANYFYVDSIFTAGTGVIKIKQIIDFDASQKLTYSFTVSVRDPDPTHVDTASVVVTVYDVNDNAPVFSRTNFSRTISESDAVGTSVAKFTATDKDPGINGKFSYYIDYRNTDPKFNFEVDPQSGDVKIRNKLDRETRRDFEVHVLAIDEGEPALTGTATLSVNVTGINDSPPALQFVLDRTAGGKPYVSADTKTGTQLLQFIATDPDNETSSTYRLSYDNSCQRCSDFSLKSDAGKYWLVTNRDGYKGSDLGISSYNLKVTASDGTNEASYPITIFVKSEDSVKTVMVYNYARSNGLYAVMPLGNANLKNLNDQDMRSKSFTLESKESIFVLRENGQLAMYGNASEREHMATVKVDGADPGTFNVNVKFINDSAVQSSGSLRLSGLEASDLLINTDKSTKLQMLQKKIADILKTKPEFVDIFSISDVAGQPQTVDVVYAAHGSPYYTPEKMNVLMWNNRADILQSTQLNVTMAPVDLCRSEFQNCWDKGCATVLNIGPNPSLININEASFVGLDGSFKQLCNCPSSMAPVTDSPPKCEAYSCYNSGTCIVNGTAIICICPIGYDGPRCQKTTISFSGAQSYIFLKPLESCEDDRLSLELITSASDALVLFNGPMSATDSVIVLDFIAIELSGGYPQLRINLGDGELLLPQAGGKSLLKVNDGKWHTLEVFHEGQQIRFVIDHCSNAPYDETLNSYSMDRSLCEASGRVPKERFLLNVAAPLQLGGRSDASFNADLKRNSFSGCVRNLIHNGELYDMSIDATRTSSGVTEGCSLGQCSSCPANGTCASGPSGASFCQCPPGFHGAQCEIPATVKSFDVGGYAIWTFKPAFSSSLNATSALDPSLQVMFRTRDGNGTILFGESFSTLERNILEIVNGYLQFRYDLGSGDQILALPNVRVDDGVWHTARVERHGNQVILWLDSGDDIFFNSTFPVDARRVLRISNLFGLGEVRTNPWTQEITVKDNLARTCLQDIRFMNQNLPLDSNDASQIADVKTNKASPDCKSTACAGVTCGTGLMCYDLWNIYECRCNDNTTIRDNGVCVAPKACFPDLCWYGGTCFVVNGAVGCICPPGRSGKFCEVQPPIEKPISNDNRSYNLVAAIVVPIIVGLLLLLLLILLIVWCLRRKPEYLLEYPDEDASRENIIAYDEEGAGEEDVQAYDLMRLQKPVDPNLDPRNEPYGLGSLLKSAPEPMSNRRQLPGDYPNIGEFINDRLKDAGDDDIDQDTLRGFDLEGGGSQAGSLSSIGSSSSGDVDFGFLNDFGPPFKKLADLYGDEDEDENEPDVSNV